MSIGYCSTLIIIPKMTKAGRSLLCLSFGAQKSLLTARHDLPIVYISFYRVQILVADTFVCWFVRNCKLFNNIGEIQHEALRSRLGYGDKFYRLGNGTARRAK
jgi:hypothetical protein